MEVKSLTRRLIVERFDDDLDAWIRHQRDAGRSWRVIAVELEKLTAVSVSHETLRKWYIP